MTSTFEPASFQFQDLLGIFNRCHRSRTALELWRMRRVDSQLNGVVHGALLFAMADTAMAAAMMSTIDDGMTCASIDVHAQSASRGGWRSRRRRPWSRMLHAVPRSRINGGERIQSLNPKASWSQSSSSVWPLASGTLA